VDVNLDDFRRHFELLSDDALLATNRDDLVKAAQSCYDEEIERRGISTASENSSEAGAEAEAAEGADSVDELVVIATYNIPEEASLARGLMESAGIPYRIDNEFAALGGIELRLRVPKSMEADAVEILEMEISEEDLAAQAEAAGMGEEDEADEFDSGQKGDTHTEPNFESR
jgi:plasmid stability protein